MNAVAYERFPHLLCPFQTASNPATTRVSRATAAWATRHNLVGSPDALRRFTRLQYTELMGLAYPHAPADILQIIADWNTWTFVFDDHSDQLSLELDPNALAALYRQLVGVLRGHAPAATDLAAVHALDDVAQRMRRYQNDEWMERFAGTLANTLQAAMWEATNRQHERVPTISEYRNMRPHTGAVFCYLELIDLANQFVMPAVVRNHAYLQHMALLANNVICWSNDIVSLLKELAQGDVHNLVYIMHHEQQIEIDDALVKVAAMHNQAVAEFLRLERTPPAFEPRDAQALARYVTGLKYWMRANMEWSTTTARYQPDSIYQRV